MDENDLLEDEGTEQVSESQEVVEDSLEEPQDSSEETEGFAEDEGGLDEIDPLDHIPEEYREFAKQYGVKQVGQIQSGWQAKLDAAAELRKKAEVVEAFNERFEKDPHGVIRELQKIAPEPQETGPEHPGEMPDPVEDHEAWKRWYAADKEYQAYQMRSVIEEQQMELKQAVQGMQQTAVQQAQQAEMSALQSEYGFGEDEMAEFYAEMAKIRQDKNYAFRTIADRVKGRKSKVQQKKAQKKRVREAVQGEEERPGLPATGVHSKPPPTGNIAADVLAELKAEGKVPDGIFD